MAPQSECWACDATDDLVYTDALGLHWCRECFDGLYWERPNGIAE